MSDSADRAIFSSRWSVVLATAGVAIGLGNIWRFPYMMGRYGGAVFLLAYLIIVAAFGVPALMVEWSLGRQTRRGTWAAFERAGMPGGRWWSRLLLLTVLMAASYYGVVIGWVLYFALASSLSGLGAGVSPRFESLVNDTWTQWILTLSTAAVGCAALHFGVRRGIEKVSRIALPLFFVLFAVLIVRVLTLDGAMDGLRAFLVPRWRDFTGSTALAALGQAFFSLGLGGTFMVTYGSYMRGEEDIPKIAILTAAADVGAAVMAGLIIVPATFAMAIPLNSGPPLLFEIMPAVFERMPGGMFWGALFFFSVFTVALLSLMAAYEVLVAAGKDALGWSRTRTLLVILVAVSLAAIPAVHSVRYVELSDLIWGTTMQPVGSIVALVAVAWCLGRVKTLEDLRRHSRLPIPLWLFYWIKYGLPLGAVAMLVFGWVGN